MDDQANDGRGAWMASEGARHGSGPKPTRLESQANLVEVVRPRIARNRALPEAFRAGAQGMDARYRTTSRLDAPEGSASQALGNFDETLFSLPKTSDDLQRFVDSVDELPLDVSCWDDFVSGTHRLTGEIVTKRSAWEALSDWEEARVLRMRPS